MAVVVVTGLYRYFYTKRTRDTRLWHRRKFEGPEVITRESPLKCDSNGNIAVDLDKILGKGTVGCAVGAYNQAKSQYNKAEAGLKDANNQIINNIKLFQETGALPQGSSSSFSICPAS
jgi:hypothetical protein